MKKSIAIVLLSTRVVMAQELDVEALLQTGADVVDRGLNEMGYELDREALNTIPRWEDVVSFWNRVRRTLSEGSVEDIAWLRPEVEAALGYLQQWPEAAPYADWLRQQVDYFAVAEAAAAAVPAAVHRPRPARSVPPLVLPPPPPPAAPERTAVRRQVNARARGIDLWRQRLKDRPLPRNAERLIPELKEIFREVEMPEALVWLAEVESTLDPRARSPVGAAGLFQFMPATAQRFGLKTARPDERLQPEKSARAAARYLRFLHGRFGSWTLALAGYNAGEGRVGGLLKKHTARSFDAIADDLPAETQMYVPKFAALLELREGLRLDQLPAPGDPKKAGASGKTLYTRPVPK